MSELELVCTEAARTLVARGRPVPATVVLPLPAATRVVALSAWPDDDPSRFDLLSRFAREEMQPRTAPCFGFVAEAVSEVDGAPGEVLLVAFSAHRHRAQVTAAPLDDVAVGDFAPAEELDPTALPFLSPLQHAVDAAVGA